MDFNAVSNHLQVIYGYMNHASDNKLINSLIINSDVNGNAWNAQTWGICLILGWNAAAQTGPKRRVAYQHETQKLAWVQKYSKESIRTSGDEEINMESLDRFCITVFQPRTALYSTAKKSTTKTHTVTTMMELWATKRPSSAALCCFSSCKREATAAMALMDDDGCPLHYNI